MNRTHLITAWKLALIAVLIAVVMSVTGCSTYQAIIAERSAEASDNATAATLWSLCNALPVGAVRREFNTEAEQAAYKAICP